MARLMGLGSGKNVAIKDYNHLVTCVSANSGNLLFNFAIENLIQLTQSDIRWSTPAEAINKENTPLVVPMANNIGPHTDVSISGPKLSGVNVLKTVIVLGAQFPVTTTDAATAAARVPQGTVDWLKTVVDNSMVPNISVRGKFTMDVLASLGFAEYAVPLGCPSHFINENRELGKLLSQKVHLLNESVPDGIVITAGNPGIKNLNKLERFLIGMIDRYDGKYVVQHPKSLICLSNRWENNVPDEELNYINDNFFPERERSQMLSWFSNKSLTYISVPQWMSDVAKHSLCVGTRIHGVQAAIQSGVPAVCLYIDSRTKELCDTMQIPAISAHTFQKAPSIEIIIETLKSWDWAAYDANRVSLARKMEVFLRENQLETRKKAII
jgi:hypothetical protein